MGCSAAHLLFVIAKQICQKIVNMFAKFSKFVSFSAVSASNFASTHAFCSMFEIYKIIQLKFQNLGLLFGRL